MEAYNPSSLPKGQRTYINEHHQLVVWPGWLAIFKRNRSGTDSNLRRALNWCKDDWDRTEILDELARRQRNRKEKHNAAQPAPVTAPAQQPAILQLVYDRMPARPYCSDQLEQGSKIRGKEEAARHKEVQLNQPWARQCLALDLDHSETLDARLPPPNVIVKNPNNGHRHALIVWKTPIIVGLQASQKAQKYYQDLARAVGQCWDADPNYTGTLAHNPLHPRWKTEILRPEPYELGDFKEALQIVRSMPANHPRMRSSEWADSYAAQGRNNRTWEACRWAAYALGTGATFNAVLELVQSFNSLHNTPALAYQECKDIAKSISRYVLSGKCKGHSMSDADWRGYVEHTHRPEVQAERGKRSGAARRAASAEQRATARLMRAQGHSSRKIAAALQINQSTVVRWLA